MLSLNTDLDGSSVHCAVNYKALYHHECAFISAFRGKERPSWNGECAALYAFNQDRFSASPFECHRNVERNVPICIAVPLRAVCDKCHMHVS